MAESEDVCIWEYDTHHDPPPCWSPIRSDDVIVSRGIYPNRTLKKQRGESRALARSPSLLRDLTALWNDIDDEIESIPKWTWGGVFYASMLGIGILLVTSIIVVGIGLYVNR